MMNSLWLLLPCACLIMVWIWRPAARACSRPLSVSTTWQGHCTTFPSSVCKHGWQAGRADKLRTPASGLTF